MIDQATEHAVNTAIAWIEATATELARHEGIDLDAAIDRQIEALRAEYPVLFAALVRAAKAELN
jgi:hypothetical protein